MEKLKDGSGTRVHQSTPCLRSDHIRASYQLPNILKLEEASQSYRLHAKTSFGIFALDATTGHRRKMK